MHLHVWIHCDVHSVTAQKKELLDQLHDAIQQLEQQQQSLQVMSLTCSNAVDWPQVCNLIESVMSNRLSSCWYIMSARLLVRGNAVVQQTCTICLSSLQSCICLKWDNAAKFCWKHADYVGGCAVERPCTLYNSRHSQNLPGLQSVTFAGLESLLQGIWEQQLPSLGWTQWTMLNRWGWHLLCCLLSKQETLRCASCMLIYPCICLYIESALLHTISSVWVCYLRITSLQVQLCACLAQELELCRCCFLLP